MLEHLPVARQSPLCKGEALQADGKQLRGGRTAKVVGAFGIGHGHIAGCLVYRQGPGER